MYNRFGLPPVNQITRPYPAIVIAVGNSTLQLTRQVERIYLRGDARRSLAVSFFQLLPDKTNELAFSPLTAEEVASADTGIWNRFFGGTQGCLT